MAKCDPKKAKGKMSVYAFFLQTCREEHKKKNPVNFAKTMSRQDKSKFAETAEADKVHCDWEMKDYGPKKNPNAFQRPQSGFFLFCSEFHPKIKSTNPSISIGDVMWNNVSDSEKQPYITKAEKNVADYKLKGKFDGAKDPAKVAQVKVEEEDEEDEEEGEEERRRMNKGTLSVSL
uniref:HMG box domain-containing protein n=1 Tax=Mandrillus leucophaeus TaxID=9568 RepID=A0A2K5YVW7_MANLE